MPEVASRHHLELIEPVVDDALRAGRARRSTTLDARRRHPGARASSARCSSASQTAKALAAARAACRWSRSTTSTATSPRASSEPEPLEPPFLCLIASGGHTLLARVRRAGPAIEVLGRTLDDAAGEAFDKGARLLGLGYPGGPALRAPGRRRRPGGVRVPDRARRCAGLDFSFAGLKTALLYELRDLGEEEARAPPRRPRGLLPARDRRDARAARRAGARADRHRPRWRSAAASRRTARCARGCAALGGRGRDPAAASSAPTTPR